MLWVLPYPSQATHLPLRILSCFWGRSLFAFIATTMKSSSLEVFLTAQTISSRLEVTVSQLH